MKLLIEINDYEKLKNIAEIAMDGKHRKTKNILLCVTGLPFFASLALMINAICYQFTCMSRTKKENHYDTPISINCCHYPSACAYFVCSIQTQTKQHQRTGSNY